MFPNLRARHRFLVTAKKIGTNCDQNYAITRKKPKRPVKIFLFAKVMQLVEAQLVIDSLAYIIVLFWLSLLCLLKPRNVASSCHLWFVPPIHLKLCSSIHSATSCLVLLA
jgi:hypothetical protein